MGREHPAAALHHPTLTDLNSIKAGVVPSMLTTRSPRRCPTAGFVCSSIVCSSTTLLIAVVLVFLLTGPPQARCANTEEFNAYRNAIMHSDPSARAISLELFLKQHPGSDFAFDAQQLLVLAYSETG